MLKTERRRRAGTLSAEEHAPGRPAPAALAQTPLAQTPLAQTPLAYVRKARILDSLRRNGAVGVGDMARSLGVSDMTIRRDLSELEREGHLTRTHGGAVLTGRTIDGDEPSFSARLARNREEKERIARAALALTDGRRAVALDIGSTTFLLADLLRHRAGLKVFTNSLKIAAALGDAAGEVYVPGGRIRGEDLAIGGPSAVEAFDKLWFDIAFIGVSGITPEGLFDYSFEDTELKRVYLRRSAEAVVLCDSAKFDRLSLVRVAGFDDVDRLVTDRPPPEAIAAALAAAGVALTLAAQPA